MKERPIIFSGPMVRAILDGSKTQTRRVMNDRFLDVHSIHDGVMQGFRCMEDGCAVFELQQTVDSTSKYKVRCPYGVPGDRLWVKETWCRVDDTECGGSPWIDYRATPWDSAEHPAGWQNAPDDPEALKWKSPRFMFKKYARLWLEVTGVRVERVRQISAADVESEGIETYTNEYGRKLYAGDNGDEQAWMPHDAAFAYLWDSLNAKRGFGWEQNPWIWVIEFKVANGSRAPFEG